MLYRNLLKQDELSSTKTCGWALTAAYMIPRLGLLSITLHKNFDKKLYLAYLSLGYTLPFQ
ncbi:MAG TPA: hypothetical protein VLB84_04895 [Bacteroidia bacterium]|jgi:hypothetical protein|nr:hypothetical protein [Bacteroidia bacterium]